MVLLLQYSTRVRTRVPVRTRVLVRTRVPSCVSAPHTQLQARWCVTHTTWLAIFACLLIAARSAPNRILGPTTACNFC
jgi:hypothetical protein